MDESERSEPSSNEPQPPSDPQPGPPHGESETPQPQGQQLGDGDANRRRRRGRRGRGGGGFGAPRPPFNQRPQYGGPRPQYGGQPFRPQPQPSREENEQSRELAAYERRMRQRGGAGAQQGWRGGPPRPAGGGWRQRGGAGQQRYQDTIRRVTAGPRATAPSHQLAGEPIAGPHAILEAMRAGRGIRRVYVSEDRGTRTGAVNDLITEAQQRRIFVRFVDKMEIDRLSPIEEHQGVVAIVEGKTGVELDELLLHLDTLSTPALVLVIDSLQDPQNFGVLLRSAEGAGVDGVVIPHHRAVGLTPAVAKTSAGASEHLLVADVANLRQAIDAIKEKGVWVVAADESGDLLYDEVDYRGPTAIVIGGEGEGIRRLVLEGCDQVVRIPMEGQVSSLNAAAAGTVLLYEALRQRRHNVPPAQTRTPRPVVVAEEIPNGEREAAEAEEGGLDETDQIAPAALEPAPTEPIEPEVREPAADAAAPTNEEAKPKKPKTPKTPRKRSPKKTTE